MARPIYEARGQTREEFKEELTRMVEEDWSMPRIAAHVGISAAAVHNWLKKFDLARRKELRDPIWLYQKYIVEKKSSAEIGEMCGVSYVAVIWHLNKHNIPIRSQLEARRNRNSANEKPHAFHGAIGSSKPFSYCFWYDGHFFASTAEYIFYKMHKDRHAIQTQPFVFENRRPDFLLDDSLVVEVKSTRKDIDDTAREDYMALGARIKEVFGYDYEIRYMKEEFPKEYEAALKWLRVNATIGESFTLAESI